MQISLRWINELVNLEIVQLDDLINKLTLGGFEVEDILEVEELTTNSTALEVSSTANRSDSLSILGLSLEIAALLKQIPKKFNYSSKTCSWYDQFENFQSKSPLKQECSGFIALTIENVSNFTSPKWLQQKLIASGLSVENNLKDFQNYILFETGYPLEFYDLDQIYLQLNSSKINLSLTSIKEESKFLANNGKEYVLDNSLSVIYAKDLPISIAGIISSAATHYSDQTQKLLVEASIFNAANIRQKSRKLALRTDRSSRYEKSLKNITLLESVYRFVSLLRIANPKLQCKLHTISQLKHESVKKIKLDYQTVKQVLGPIKLSTTIKEEYISPKSISEALKRLNFKVNYDTTNFKWEVSVPSLRNDDIVREIDVIEEIGRMYGFNNFLTRLPNLKIIGTEDFDYQTRKRLTSSFIALGFNELVQYSLVKNKTYLTNEIELLNPLIQDYSNLRSSLLPNLIRAIEENLKNGNQVLEGFEYGHIFLQNSSSNTIEIEVVAGIFGGIKSKQSWTQSIEPIGWFEAKGKMEQFFKTLNIITYWKSYKPLKEKNILHLYCSSELFLSTGQKIGVFGQISPILSNKLNISPDTYLFEFNFEVIKCQLQQNRLTIYQEYSLYPKVVKDLSFVVKKSIPFHRIKKILYLNGSSFLKEINLLDEYQGKSVPEQHTSLCLQLVFQSKSETLQNEKVETIIKNLTNVLNKKFNAKTRI